jgi:hypothetical protein
MIQHAVAAALLLTQAAPPGGPPNCLTRQAAGDLAVVGASIFVRGARDLCRERLPAGAYLVSPAGEQYDSALRSEAERRLDSAATGVDRLFSPGGDGPALFGIMLRGLMSSGPPPQIAGLVDAPSCADLSLMVEALSGMSADDLAQFASAAMALGSRMHQQQQARAAERRAENAAEDDSQPPVMMVPAEPGLPKPPRSSQSETDAEPAVPAPPAHTEPPRPTGPFICPA